MDRRCAAQKSLWFVIFLGSAAKFTIVEDFAFALVAKAHHIYYFLFLIFYLIGVITMDKQNRKAIIAGNWKMNKTATEAKALIS